MKKKPVDLQDRGDVTPSNFRFEGRSGKRGLAISVPATEFFNKTYDEAAGLLHEAHGEIAALQRAGSASGSWAARLVYARETMRLTARLNQIMAWLLLQRAINEGTVDRAAAAAEENRFGARPVCLVHDEAALALLPPALQSLLERSHRLYVRVARLDEMIGRDDVGRGPPPISL